GSAADLMKKAMVDVHAELRSEGDRAAILLTVHDELVLEAVEDRAEEVCRRCRERVEQALRLDVPTPVEISMGPSWADLN
ncbi:MAG TPA: DNA polymerase, partial [bacterium]|nr:DNA polymerase [bacterium]